MNADLDMLRGLGEGLKPSVEQPPVDLRHRVLTGLRHAEVSHSRRLWAGVRSLRWRVLAAAATAVAAAAAITALTLPGVEPGSRKPDVSQVAARTPSQVLQLAAAQATTRAAQKPRADQYVFTEWIEVVQKFRLRESRLVFEVGEPVVVRQWRSADGSRGGLIQRRTSGGNWQETPVAPCRKIPSGKVRQDASIAGCSLVAGHDAGLPTDGDAMYDYLYRAKGSTDDLLTLAGADVPALANAAEVLRLGRLSPQVQAAVFDAIGRIPGVRLKAGVMDVSGRSGVALVFDGPGGETELIFDSHTYEYLGMNQRIVGSGWRPVPGRNAFVVADTPVRQAILRVAVVDRAGALP
ncbi:CU044_5270 family protein [Micromonospora sp. NBC_01392]|uniref:CU044_5270 family protein n=1 Tax=Micromonospora sp. NBC_01392 TaxID=2903588 RepID=UPI0032437C53